MNFWTYSTKRYTLFGLTLFVLSGPLAFAADFGVANWRMTPEEIKLAESRSNLTPFLEDNYLVYRVSLPGIEQARIVYQFSDGLLNQGRFLFRTNNPMDAEQAVKQYQTIKMMMTEQFGPPNVDQVISRDDNSEQLSHIDLANELASDRLILKSSWRSANANMHHQLAWSNGKPHHQIHYLPVAPLTEVAPKDAF